MRRSALRRSSLPSVADRPPPTSLPHSLYRSTGRRLFQNSVVTSICIPTRVYVYRPSHMYIDPRICISTRLYVGYMYIDTGICISTSVYRNKDESLTRGGQCQFGYMPFVAKLYFLRYLYADCVICIYPPHYYT